MSLRHSTREHHAPTELYEPDAGSVKHRSGGGAHKRKASVPKVAKKKTGTALKTTSAKGKKKSESSKTKTTTSSSSSKAKKKQRREPSITPSPSRARSASPAAKRKASSSKAKTKGTKRAASSTKSKTASTKSKAGSSKKRRTAVHNPRIAAIPNDATSADSEHNTPQHNPKTEAKRMSHYTPSELHQAQHIEESYEAKGMGEKKAKAIAFATVNKLRAQHGETMTSSE